MNINWHGQFCFQITTNQKKGEQVSVLIDPLEEGVGLKLPKLKTDILLTTHENKLGLPEMIGDETLLISGPGEYEIKEVFIQGIPIEKSKTTIYTIMAEEIRLCHLGNLAAEELTSKQLDEIGEIDILFVPVGGGSAMGPEKAAKIIKQIEPRIAIPMNYQLPGLKLPLGELSQFLNEMGIETVEEQNKLSIKSKDLPLENTTVMVIKP
ncbi:MAG: MBL fold metallo-hydrolase [bacterium]